MGQAMIWVKPKQLGRLTAWRVRCAACDLSVEPCRHKQTAESLAHQHARDAHQGRAVVAIAQPRRSNQKGTT